MAVTPGTIAVALGRTAPAEDSAEFAQWEMWIADALMLIEARLGPTTELDQAKLDYVVREAVVAQVQRPDDATTVDVRLDDGAVSKTYRSSAGRVHIRDEWWDLLSPTDSRGAFTIDTATGSGLLPGHADICALNLGANYCSCGAVLTENLYPLYEVNP